MRKHAVQFEAFPSLRMWGHAGALRNQTLAWSILLASLSLATWGAVESWRALERLHALSEIESSLHARISEATSRSARSTPSGGSDAIELPPDSRKGINRVIRRLNTPWPQIFTSIEQHTPPQVAILRLEPDGQGALTIEAESASIDPIIAFAEDLAHKGVFGALSYRRHNTNDQDPNKPVRLTFQLVLKEGS